MNYKTTTNPILFTNRTNTSFDTLLRSIARKPILSEEQEARLIRQAQAGNARALNRLVECNMRYVVSVAKTFIPRLYYCSRCIDINDLVMVGANGLSTAIKRFDARFGTRLLTYANSYIRRDIMELLEKNNLPENFTSTTQILPEDLEGLDESGIDMITKLRPSYTNEYYYDEEGQPDLDRLSSTTATPDQLLEKETRNSALIACLHYVLSPKEEEVMLMSLGFTSAIGPMNSAQIATQMGCSVDTVQRHYHNAVEKLRKNDNMKRLAA